MSRYFQDIKWNEIIQRWEGGKPQPGFSVYTLGNPIIAQGIVKRNALAAYHIPPRFVVTENQDGQGTTVTYHLPSTAMVAGGDASDEILFQRVTDLADKLEELVKKITQPPAVLAN